MAILVRSTALQIVTSSVPVIPADRNFAWNPGLMSKGGASGAGIPVRNTIFTTVSPLGGGADDTSAIQTAINSCPAGQVVLLSAGTFTLASYQNPLIVSSSITLRGSGAGTTILQKGATGAPNVTNPAAARLGTTITGTTINTPVIQSGLDNSPIILVGPGRFAGVDNHDSGSSAPGSTSNLTVDGFAGSKSITVANGAIFTVGRFVLLDELSLPSFTPPPKGLLNNNTNGTEGTVRVLSGDRITYNMHGNANDSFPNSASFTGSISGTTLTVSAISAGVIQVNHQLGGTGVTGGTTISALGSGTGGTGTYTVSTSQTAASAPMTTVSAQLQTFQDDPADAFGWFSRPDPITVATGFYTDGRLTCEIKEIASINGNVITFTSPLSISYRTSHTAQLTRYTTTPATGNSVHLTNAGVENLTVTLSGGGGIFFNCAAYCWAKNVEVDTCFGLGIAVSGSFRVEVRDSYIHTSAQPTPAADSYAINLLNGSSECLIENNIMRDYCKVIAFRACGAGSVVGYNYTDDGWDFYGTGNPTTDGQNAAFQECGINASHMAGPHHVLFEGNYSFNADSDYTHGNSIYMTFFRNWLTGTRTSFTGETGARCGGGAMYSYSISYVGNVLGKSGQMTGWTYTDSRMGCDSNGNSCVASPNSGWNNSLFWSNNSIWKIGYDPERWACNPDAQTLTSMIRDGNWDHLTSSQRWHNTSGKFTIPYSLYLTAQPTFFGAHAWPWVDPATGNTLTLPAKARYDAGTPNTP